MITVSEIARAMRISHNRLNQDIENNIVACVLDLQRVGVCINERSDDKLIDKAVELFCKSDFDYQGKGENFQKKYEQLRDSLSLCERYKEKVEGDA